VKIWVFEISEEHESSWFELYITPPSTQKLVEDFERIIGYPPTGATLKIIENIGPDYDAKSKSWYMVRLREREIK